jgi:hypothetical protein
MSMLARKDSLAEWAFEANKALGNADERVESDDKFEMEGSESEVRASRPREGVMFELLA